MQSFRVRPTRVPVQRAVLTPPLGRSSAAPRHRQRISPLLTALAVSAAAVAGAVLTLPRALDGAGEQPGGLANPSAGAPAPAPVRGQAAALARRAALADLLQARAEALLAGDLEGWLRPLDPAAGRFRADQGRLFDRLQLIPWTAWRYEVEPDAATLPADRLAELGPESWLASVTLHYSIAGDHRATRRAQWLTVRWHGDRWVLSADTDGETQRDLWDLGEISVARSARSVVIGSREVGGLAEYAQDTDAAAVRIDRLWGADWPRQVVLLAPATLSQMGVLLNRSSAAGLDQVAAVTTGEVERRDGGRPPGPTADRIVLNPTAFAELDSRGRQIVLTHELAHVATRAAATVSTPVWLEEGFADLLAYQDSGLDTADIAAELLAAVRLGRAPDRLPDAADFDPARGDVAVAYAGAWLALDLIAAGDLDRAVGFYRVAATAGVAAAFDQVLGMSQQRFEQEWQRHLARAAQP